MHVYVPSKIREIHDSMHYTEIDTQE